MNDRSEISITCGLEDLDQLGQGPLLPDNKEYLPGQCRGNCFSMDTPDPIETVDRSAEPALKHDSTDIVIELDGRPLTRGARVDITVSIRSATEGHDVLNTGVRVRAGSRSNAEMGLDQLGKAT